MTNNKWPTRQQLEQRQRELEALKRGEVPEVVTNHREFLERLPKKSDKPKN